MRTTQNETVRLAELARIEPGQGFGIITNQTFENCIILGPAVCVSTLIGRSTIEKSTFVGQADSTFWGLPPGKYEGVIALVNVRFVDCEFSGVAFANAGSDRLGERGDGHYDVA